MIFPPVPTQSYVSGVERGGMKSYEVSKFVAYSATVGKKRCVILRDEKARIKESILNEIWTRYETANSNGILDAYFDKMETELKEKRTGDTLLYTMGFRASNSDKKAALKGPSNIDIAVIEEAEDIRDVDKFNTFADSLRKQGVIKIIMLNTPDLGHWLVKRYFSSRQVEDGYYELIPNKIPGFICIQTSFEDNPYLPEIVVSNYKGYGDPKHHMFNKHYFMTSILGLASSGRKGQVFTKIKRIKLKDYLALPYKEMYGQDFGTASPAALCGAKFYQNTCWARLINYKPMDVLMLGRLYATLKFDKQDRIVCDYAEPDTIKTLKTGWKRLPAKEYELYPQLRNGFFVVPCPSKDISARISVANSMTLFVVEEDTEAWEEIDNYIYATDKNGNYTNEPIDDYNHFLDAWMYLIMDQRGKAFSAHTAKKLY